MPLVLVILGLLLFFAGFKGTHKQLFEVFGNTFTGPPPFLAWVTAIGAVGSLGYIDDFRALSRTFIVLIIVAMVLSNRGFAARLQEALDAASKGGAPKSTGQPESRATPPASANVSDFLKLVQ